MAYRILGDGIRQDHRGRLYRTAVYPNGKTIIVPCTNDHTLPMERTIPVVEYKPKPRRILTVKPLDMSRRRMRVDFRVRGETEVRTILARNLDAQLFVDQNRAYQDNEDNLVRKGNWDWFFQCHIDLKEESNAQG